LSLAPFSTSLKTTHPLRAGDVQLYEVCDLLTEVLIYAMVVISPWTFGTTQPWSVWLMNALGYLLGAFLACKWGIRRFRGYQPPLWEASRTLLRHGRDEAKTTGRSVFTTALAVLTVVILAYCVISAVNARATYLPGRLSFSYQECLPWLPHSLDGRHTWLAFCMYLGLASAFWAVWDWLRGKTDAEVRSERRGPEFEASSSAPLLPARMRRLLWVLAINGALLGLEGIAQRIEGSGKLLFLVKPHVNPGASAQFGPYAYRANASQYFNLLWPVCLGFWWTLNQSRTTRAKGNYLILIACVVMAACPIISTSRAGALITISIVLLATLFLSATHFLLDSRRPETSKVRKATLACLVLFLTASLALGLGLGWKALKPRLAQLDEGFELREKMYETARPMARDYPWFGTGPGTFETVFQLYRTTTATYWPAQLHNDWLETRITFGWVGSGLIALAFGIVLLRWFARGGIHAGRRFIVLIWLSLAGCLVHARYDFPFQIYSILFLFLVICAVLFTLTRRP